MSQSELEATVCSRREVRKNGLVGYSGCHSNVLFSETIVHELCCHYKPAQKGR